MIEFKISGEANRCLLAQRGDFAGFAGAKFQQAWSDEIEKTIKQIGIVPKHVLDIGSGLGLIDIELFRRFGTYCTLIDGKKMPEVIKHDVPFCDREVVERFWMDNDVPTSAWQYLTPEQLDGFHGTFDLVLGLRSWCFHFAPQTYSAFVVDHLAPQATILVDVRRSNVDWLQFLESAFLGHPNKRRQVCVEVGDKYLRMKYNTGSVT